MKRIIYFMSRKHTIYVVIYNIYLIYYIFYVYMVYVIIYNIYYNIYIISLIYIIHIIILQQMSNHKFPNKNFHYQNMCGLGLVTDGGYL